MLCHVELASTVRDEERNYTIAAQCDREALQPLSTKHSISVGMPVVLQSGLYQRYFREHKRCKNTGRLTPTDRKTDAGLFHPHTLFFQ